jgi:hypothetical protein
MTLKDIRLGLVEFLLDDATIAATVGDRVFPVTFDQGKKDPSIVYTRISGQGDHTMQGASLIARPRYQIDAYATTPGAATDLANLIKERLDGYQGAMPYGSSSPQDEIDVMGVFFVDEREGYESEAGMYRVSRDYFIWHREE